MSAKHATSRPAAIDGSAKTGLVMQERVKKYFRDNTSFDGLGRASLQSGAVLIAGRLVNVFVQVGSTIILARLLGPADFGIVALALALVAFAPIIVDFGTADASNQQEQITPAAISSLFWFNMTIGGVFTLVFALCSPLIAKLFSQPSLTGIMLVISLTFVVQAMSIQHSSLLRRAMEFNRIAAIEITANVVSSIVAVAMALTGWGYWSIAVKSILGLFLIAVGTWIMCPWVPGRPQVTPEVKKLVRFGSGVTGFGVADTVAWSLDRAALGYFFGPGPVGYYQNAFLLFMNAINILTNSLHNVAISGLSKLRDNSDALKRAWFEGLSLVTFVSSLAFALLAVVANDVVTVLLGPAWAPTGILLCIFALRGIPQSAERTLGWLHVVAGRSDRWMRWGVISMIFQLAALCAGLPFGTEGVAVSYAIAALLLYLPALAYAGQPLGITTRDVLKATAPPMVGGFAAAAIGMIVQHFYLLGLPLFLRVTIVSALCCAVYLLIVVVIFKVRRPIELVASVGRDVSKRFT